MSYCHTHIYASTLTVRLCVYRLFIDGLFFRKRVHSYKTKNMLYITSLQRSNV